MLYIKVLIKTVNFKGLKYCVLLMMLASSSCVFAQKKMADDHKLDSLSFSDRVSLRTNGIDWMMLLANVGIEFDLGKYNWSRNAIGLNVRGNWDTRHTFDPGVVYNLFEVRAEFRNYWRTRKTSNELGPHRHTYEKIFSGRRRRPRHPRTTWYRGAYLAYDDYSFLFGKEGMQGQAYTLGFQYGIIRPLYIFQSGKSVDLDFGFSAGFCLTDYEKYSYDSQNSKYYTVREKTGLKLVPYPILTEARVGLVYRLGREANIYNKYRWRYDVDLKYQEKVLADLDYRAELRKRDQDYLKIYRFYQNKYDSLLIINMRNHESILDQKLADTRDMKRKADKAREEQARKVQEQARERQREERIKAQEQKAKEDSIALVDKANARKVEEQVRQQIEADKLKEAEERKLEKALDAEEKALLKQNAAEERKIEKQMAEENRKYEEEKRKRMNEAYAEQRRYDAEQKALQKEREAKEAAKEKERIANQKEWQRTLDRQEKEAKKKRAQQLKKQSRVLNGEEDDDYSSSDDVDDDDDAASKAEAAKAERDAKKRAQEEAKAKAKAEKEAAKEAAKAEKEAKKKAEAEAKAAAKAAKNNK